MKGDNKNFNPGERVFFIRRCNTNTALSSEVETGAYVDDTPGWIFDRHVRIQPDSTEKVISVPVSRVWYLTHEGQIEASEFVKNLIARQTQSYKILEERLEASKWKLEQLTQIFTDLVTRSVE